MHANKELELKTTWGCTKYKLIFLRILLVQATSSLMYILTLSINTSLKTKQLIGPGRTGLARFVFVIQLHSIMDYNLEQQTKSCTYLPSQSTPD